MRHLIEIVFIVACLGATGWVVYHIVRAAPDPAAATAAAESAREQRERAEQRLQHAQAALESHQQDLTKETVIRDQLLYQKPGEIVLQLPPIDVSPTPIITPTPSPSPWQAWRTEFGL
jgi:hypothetical protein